MDLIKFNLDSTISNWRIVNDVVMGGKSNGNFELNDEGLGVFYGNVSLENNGGFSMVQYPFEPKMVNDYSKISIRLKGDGKTYQFRVKSKTNEKHSYVIPFETSGDWENIELSFNSLYPAFRGKKLNTTNYPGEQMELIAFLIGNKAAENFKLIINSIVLS